MQDVFVVDVSCTVVIEEGKLKSFPTIQIYNDIKPPNILVDDWDDPDRVRLEPQLLDVQLIVIRLVAG